MTKINDFQQHKDIDCVVELFLSALDPRPSALFNIEHFTDLPKGEEKPDPDPLLGQHPSLSANEVIQLVPTLKKLNEKGAAIFIARNECNGQRNKNSISRIRGPHADFDNATEKQIADAYRTLPPTIIVTTSDPGRQHAYWQLAEGENLSASDTESVNRVLVSDFGADGGAVDISRLLRLPGFKHMKYRGQGRTPIVTAKYSGRRYAANEIKKAFLEYLPKNPSHQRKLSPSGIERRASGPLLPEIIGNITQRAARQKPELWAGDWEKATNKSGKDFSSQSEADLALTGHIARECAKAGLAGTDLTEAVEDVFQQSGLAQRDKWHNRSDYRERTIAKATSGLPNTSTPNEQSYGLNSASHGDVKNARFFADYIRGRLMYVPSRGRWLRWEDSHFDRARWTLCEKGEELAEAKRFCNLLLQQATTLFSIDQDKGKKAIAEAMSAHFLPRIQAMLKLSVSEPGISVMENELNRDPYILGVTNGAIDLRSGQHLPNSPDLLITRHCNAEFVDDAPCPRWIRFLDQIFEGDQDTIDCVQRLLGYTLIGNANEEILIICYGFGSNGKSVLNNVVQEIVGEYAVTAPSSLLVVRRSGDSSPRNDLAALAGSRYVSINEIQAGDRLDEQIVKILAGRERISARFLHREFFDYQPDFTAWLRTNHKPIIVGEDDGIWRRLIMLRFARQFKDHEKDAHLQERLLEEREGILQWMLEGVRLYIKDGIKPSARMSMETATYRKESDLLGEFLQDKTTPDISGRINQINLYSDYQNWCKESGLRANSKKSFTQRLAERGFRESKSGRDRYYTGLSYPAVAGPKAQDGVDRIFIDSDKHLHKNALSEKTEINQHPVHLAQKTDQRLIVGT